MAKRKRKPEKVARVVLALLGIGLLLWNANSAGLYLLGGVAPAYDVSLSRLGTRGESGVDSEYRFSVSYKYIVDGVEYEGLDTGLHGPWLGPKVDNTVHYYTFAPRISSLCAEGVGSLRFFLVSGFSLALILLAVIPRKRGNGITLAKENRGREAQPDSERVTMAWLMENTEGYDDTLEEYYQNDWVKGDPSWECACGKWNTGSFCEVCGLPRQR